MILFLQLFEITEVVFLYCLVFFFGLVISYWSSCSLSMVTSYCHMKYLVQVQDDWCFTREIIVFYFITILPFLSHSESATFLHLTSVLLSVCLALSLGLTLANNLAE